MIVTCLYAAVTLRTLWLSSTPGPEGDGTPIMSFALLVLCPLSVVAVICLALDMGRALREGFRDWRILAMATCEVVGLGGTLAVLIE